MGLVHYDYWGLHLASNQPWTALAPFRSRPSGVPADVLIHTQADRLADPATEVVIDPLRASIQIAGVGRYIVRDGRRIDVTPAAAARRGALEVFLLGSAWGALSYQRRLLALHTGVVQAGDGVLAFCGPSGAGKSSLVAWLNQRGYPLLGDDLCRCDPHAQPAPLVWPSLQRAKLWRAALAALGQAAHGLVQDWLEEDKFQLPPLAHAVGNPQPLRAIYLLEWGPLALERLTGTRALRQFVSYCTYRPGQLEAMGLLGWYWQTCADLLRRVPIYRLSRPKDWACMPDVLALIDPDASNEN